jgi:hypothetical protein
MAELQLREYLIADGHLREFIAAWRTGVVPLRRAAGFTIQAWTVERESRFIWILGYAGPGTFSDADQAYYGSPARAALDPDPGQWVLEKRHTMVTPVVREE